jgi:hypothetical protein
MSAGDDFLRTHDLLIDELTPNVGLVLLARRWRRAIERDISALEQTWP